MKHKDVFVEVPVIPEPKVFCCNEIVPRQELAWLTERGGHELLQERVKATIANKLARFILANTQLIIEDDYSTGGKRTRIEITMSDRGTYQNWLPVERGIGRQEGRAQVIASIPYGLEPGQFYE